MEPGLFIFVVVISYAILYFVIKYAVKSAIMEARWEADRAAESRDGGGIKDMEADEYTLVDSNGGIAKIICPKCGRRYDMDYPKCPYCEYGAGRRA